MLDARDFDNRFISVPLVGIQVKKRHQLDSHIIEHRRKVGTPVADCGMGNLDIKGGAQDEADITERVFAEVKHR